MKKWLENSWIVTGFFGYNNWKRLISELIKLYSDKPSFFSRKRIESGIAFIIFQWGMFTWLYHNMDCPMSELAIWASIQAFVCGYALKEIQKEKVFNKTSKDETKE